jgi:transmembrane sensor
MNPVYCLFKRLEITEQKTDMSNTTLPDLFRKYLDDSITPDEFSQLYELINSEYDKEAMEQAWRGSFSNRSLTGNARDYDLKEVFAQLRARINEKKADEALAVYSIPTGRKTAFLWRRSVAIAASLILLLGAGTWLWLGRSPKQAPLQAHAPAPVRNDVLPGHDGAILTLANGQQIVLDSAHNGALATQGGSRVTKLKNGQLSYTSLNERPGQILYNTLTTPRARQTTLILADGTHVWLNAASSIKYPTAFSGRERRVEVSGEVYFEVQKDAGKPFTVHPAGSDGSIGVLGTSFNVNAYDDEEAVKTTLLEGSVKVARGKNSSTLRPGQQAVLGRGGEGIQILDDADLDEVMAWKNNRFQFSNMDLKTIMRQLARWYDVDVVFEGKVPDIRVGGFIHKDVNLSTVMEFLGENKIHYRIEGKKIIILQ